MKTRIRMFAGLKDFFDKEMELEVSTNATIAELKDRLVIDRPEAKELIGLCRFACGTEFVDETHTIQEEDTISFLPPSSGG